MNKIMYYKQDLTPVLIEKRFQVFTHGCNCFCTMGAGIAKTVKRIFPEVYRLDCSTGNGRKSKLGTISSCEVGENKFVINAYTQYDFRGRSPNVNYKAIRRCMQGINSFMLEKKLNELTLPKIGAGLAGGDWNVIEGIILEEINPEIAVRIFYL